MNQNGTGLRVSAKAIAGFIADALATQGLSPADAGKVAELMTEADLTGADAHGVFRLAQYVRRLRGGAVNPKPNIQVEQTAPATAIVDGDNGMGHLVMAKAAETAVALARETGFAWVGARRSNHAGAAGVYAALPLADDMVGIYSVVASANHMAIWGGVETLLGTNPIAFAIPAGEEAPVVLDIATTVVSYGTVKNYRLQGKTMPEGWMVSTQGRRGRSPIRTRAPRACSPRSAATRAAVSRSCSACSPGRSTAPASGATSSTSTTTKKTPATPGTSSWRSTSSASRRSTRSRPKWTGICATCVHRARCRASMRCACRGRSAASGAQDRLDHGVPMPAELIAQLDGLAGELGVKPLRGR